MSEHQRPKGYVAPRSEDELVDRYDHGERYFRGASLTGADLHKLGLQGADLSDSDLSDASLMKADLREAILRRAELTRAKLMDARIDATDFRGATLAGVDLSRATLSNAILDEAQLTLADFSGAVLQDASLRAVIAKDPRETKTWAHLLIDALSPPKRWVDFRDADLTRAQFTKARLTKASFEGATLERASFKDAILVEGRFHQGVHERVSFWSCRLDTCSFTQLKLPLANFEYAELSTCHFSEVSLRGATFEGAKLSGCLFENVDLRGVSFLNLKSPPERLEEVWIDAQTYQRSEWSPETLQNWVRRGALIDEPGAFPEGALMQSEPDSGEGLEANGRQTWPENRAVGIRRVELKNMRTFETLSLELTPSDERGQWVVLLGDNGTGKTTILRSLVLALLDWRLAEALLKDEAAQAPFLRHGCEEGRVVVEMSARIGLQLVPDYPGADQGEVSGPVPLRFPCFLRLDAEEEFETLARQTVSRYATFGPRPTIYAYGSKRGSALGGAAREVSFGPLDGVATLFEEGASLIHAESWLKNLRLAATEREANERFYDAVIETLCRLLPDVTDIEVTSKRVLIKGLEREPTTLAGLSDGYLTTCGWIIDFIARWSERASRLGVELTEDFREKMNALVLVDEIDLHLHPRWQTEVISTLRELFPKTSFIVTTHNPLTLLGAKEGEVFVLQRADPARPPSVRQVDIPPGSDADAILTGAWFGLASTLDRETLTLFERHMQMLRDQVPEEDEDRREVERELKRRMGTYADTAYDRIALSIAAEYMDETLEGFRERDHEEREELREEIRERFIERMKAHEREG